MLRGDVMCRWYHEALDNMRRPVLAGAETLTPEDHDLRLFVTVTDFYGYGRDIPIERPRKISDWRHRPVFEFRREGGRNQFTDDDTAGLAFACRATSSFPGAFPAITFADFEACFDPTLDLSDFAEEFCRVYSLAGKSARETYFIDGGVLNNFPFDPAIQAIRKRVA